MPDPPERSARVCVVVPKAATVNTLVTIWWRVAHRWV